MESGSATSSLPSRPSLRKAVRSTMASGKHVKPVHPRSRRSCPSRHPKLATPIAAATRASRGLCETMTSTEASSLPFSSVKLAVLAKPFGARSPSTNIAPLALRSASAGSVAQPSSRLAFSSPERSSSRLPAEDASSTAPEHAPVVTTSSTSSPSSLAAAMASAASLSPPLREAGATVTTLMPASAVTCEGDDLLEASRNARTSQAVVICSALSPSAAPRRRVQLASDGVIDGVS
mmetsp:Transcript_87689/g.246347  ORF Transcript_87689/g.246347 Transcript_87689/m.246347 type:complete len:235 (+) Transcript_87689:712-1416(+)